MIYAHLRQSNQNSALLNQDNINQRGMSSRIALGWRWPKGAREPSSMLLVPVIVIPQEQHEAQQEARPAPTISTQQRKWTSVSTFLKTQNEP